MSDGFPIEVGGRYFVKPWKLMAEEHNIDTEGHIIMSKRLLFTTEMEDILKGTDRIVTINRIDTNNGIRYITDRLKNYSVTRDMLLGPAFEYREEAEFSDGGIYWHPNKFSGITPGDAYKYHCIGNSSYKYARPIKKEKPKEEPKHEIEKYPLTYIEDAKAAAKLGRAFAIFHSLMHWLSIKHHCQEALKTGVGSSYCSLCHRYPISHINPEDNTLCPLYRCDGHSCCVEWELAMNGDPDPLIARLTNLLLEEIGYDRE